MAVGIDWLHHALSEEERDHFATALIDKALRASLKVAEENNWVSGNNDWTAVCHGGLLVAALSVTEREPDLVKLIRLPDRRRQGRAHINAVYSLQSNPSQRRDAIASLTLHNGIH